MRHYTLLLITLAVLMPIIGNAQPKAWTAEAPEGSGTVSDPYQIATPENLYWLSYNVNKYGTLGKYYVQTADIDMSGYAEWMPIGNSNGSGFFGDYDGQGHVIKGMRVDWGDHALAVQSTDAKPNVSHSSSSNIAYGLFGWFGGKVRNLVIEDAELYRNNTCTKDGKSLDLRLGILAGSVGAKDANGGATEIKNIVVRNSRITDSAENELYAAAYFIGGLIGDIHGYGYTSSSAPTAAISIHHIYCDVDINIPNTILNPKRDWSNKGNQYNVGGFIGRIRTLPLAYTPKNVLYTGTINAPTALVGPIYGVARGNGSTALTSVVGLKNAYAGDFTDKKNGDCTTETDFPTAYYYDYKVYNYSSGTGVSADITDDNSALVTNANNTRTFRTHDSGLTISAAADITPANMSAFQGVNRGVYLPASTSTSTIYETVFENSDEDYNIAYTDSKWGLTKTEEAAITLAVTHSAWDTYTAQPIDNETQEPLSGDFTYRWDIIAVNGDITYTTSTAGPVLKYDHLVPSTSTLQVTMCDTSGTPVKSNGKTVSVSMYFDFEGNNVREFSADGQRFYGTITYGGGQLVPLGDVSGITHVWTIKRSGVELTDEPIEKWATEDQTVLFVKDHCFAERKANVTFTDRYGTALTCTDATVAASNARSIIKNNNLRNTFSPRYRWVGCNYDINPEPSYNITYDYTILDTDLVNVPLQPDDKGVFEIKKVYFQDRLYYINATDKFGIVWPNATQSKPTMSIDGASDMSLSVKDGKVMPRYMIKNNFYYVDRDEAALTYQWTIVYSKDGATIKTVTYDAPYIESLEAYDVDITLVATDETGDTATATLSYKVAEHTDVLVTSDKHDGKYDFSAVYSFKSGAAISGSNGTYQWYGIPGTVTGNISDYDILALEGANTLEDAGRYDYNSFCVVYTDTDGKQYMGYAFIRDIIYVYNRADTEAYSNGASITAGGKYYDIYSAYDDGDDANDGRTPATAVKTMARAYELLDANKPKEVNTVVIMGFHANDGYLDHELNLPMDIYRKPATITGTDNAYIRAIGTLELYGEDKISGENSRKGLAAPTIFEHLNLNGKNLTLLFYCNLNDFTVGEGVRTENYSVTSANVNGLGDYSAPSFTITAGMHNYDNNPLVYPETNAEQGTTSIIIRSGCFGRIIASARNNNYASDGIGKTNYNPNSNNCFGHPDYPHRVIVKIAIEHESTSRLEYSDKAYDYDIGLLVGGQTDGTTYADSRLEMTAGSVGRFIAGNISYGRKVGAGSPPDSFFGSTELTLKGGNIGELIGGTLGRLAETGTPTQTCQAYFYGRSIINLEGGIVNGNIYGAGAGGVVGLGDDTHHTLDEFVPYITEELDQYGRRVVKYGIYATAKGKLPTMTLHDGTVLDLADSYCEVNIKGGHVYGSVYGGGYGHSKQIAVGYALSQAGYLFGTPTVRVSGGEIDGNVYGGGEGSDIYYNEAAAGKKDDFKSLANVYGNPRIEITGGVINGYVAGGGKGMASMPDMAHIYCDSTVVILDGGEVNGNIYGGCDFARMEGDTHVYVSSGIVGDCIFGGSHGDATPGAESDTYVNGDTYVTITGGDWIGTPYINKVDRTDGYRTFNIYGGGDQKCTVTGTSHVYATSSLMTHHGSFIPREENPNSYDKDDYSDFQGPYMDLTYRRFSIYGGGYGKLTECLNTDVRVITSTDMVKPDWFTLPDFLDHQSFFDIAGGGYSGNIGHWEDDTYTNYVGGTCSVLIDGYTYCRKVIGGGFYGSCYDTNTHIRCGSLRQVYGGSLLGFVYGKAKLTVGNRIEDEPQAAQLNKYIYITENLYGGNDVRGIIGTKLEKIGTSGPVWTTETETDDKGIELNIYGGTMMGDIYGAGNGHYRGYYVGEWARYEDGPDEMYRMIRASVGDKTRKVKAYNSRPMVGRVNVDIRGNSDTDLVHMTGNVFGGGRECTIGLWRTSETLGVGTGVGGLRELTDGGYLRMNLGGYTHIDGILYMGVEGHLYASQDAIPTVIDLNTFDGSTTNELNKIGDSAYYSWYFNTEHDRYEPGFPAPGKTEGNFGMDGQTLFSRYVSNIEMKADVELTFYRDILDDNGARKHWLPAEKAFELYDAQGIRMKSFFLGGKSGSMTNGSVMHYDYDDATDKDFGAIYRVSMPAGVTIQDMLVMGSENAIIKFYPYTEGCWGVDTSGEPYYIYEGGIGPRDGGKEGRTVSKLTAMCNFDPQMTDMETHTAVDSDLHRLYGGIIYGGCYNSGTVSGDVVLNVASNMLGDRIDQAIAESKSDDLDYLPLTEWFGELSSLKHYLGRVYGGGFGKDTRIDGDTYVNLLLDFKGMNVFGGGMKGDVAGASHIVYAGSESGSYIFGSIYGGGLQGSMGYANGVDQTVDGVKTRVYQKSATNLELYSGNVDKVYGGSCLGELYGSVRVKLCDKNTDDFTHLDYETFVDFTKSVPDWSASRLIAGSVFGGNDIAGIIHYTAPPIKGIGTSSPNFYSVYIDVCEEPDADKKDTPGTTAGYSGFPLIGNLYGGSNGDYGEHGPVVYTEGEIELATGQINAEGKMTIETICLAEHQDADGNTMPAYTVPNVDRAFINITGGTMANVYGGADASTIIEHNRISVAYPDEANDARAGFRSFNDIARFYQLAHMVSREQINELTTKQTDAATRQGYIFDNHINRLFGGNNNADMDIQPEWNLIQGHVGSVYSGGNFGKMTYFDGVNDRGLSLVIDSRKFHARSVYGGGRVGDIDPAVPTTFDTSGSAMAMPDDFYGATLEIRDGVIDHVFGGNDVSGVVNYGTHVIINGAISGDVYCAGNGNYRYRYEPDNTAEKIEERYDDTYGGRYFALPQKAGFGDTGLDKIRAINSYRPNVDRTLMTIAGKSETDIAYVRGSVYCGGNSATVLANVDEGVMNDIKFEIGDNVLLNGVFLGSNGQDLMAMIPMTEKLNDLDLTHDSGVTGDDALLYPHLLDVYMQAVEVCGVPDEFRIRDDVSNAYIGDFYIGGNRGSMMTDRTIRIDFPESVVFYGKVVGGSNRANVTYKGTKHVGGLNKKLAEGLANKVELSIRSRFEPWVLDYPQDGDIKAIRRMLDVTETYGKPSFSRYRCNVYGGCFTSGRTVGGIKIDLYSDLIGAPEAGTELADAFSAAALDKKEMILNGINRSGDDQHRTFSLIGGGYGVDTEVYGDINLNLLPSGSGKHPSAATVFGGSQDGTVIGNTTVMLRDGTVLTNLYGASESTPMYGSSQVIIGWPDYYVCNTQGTYTVKRADELSETAKGGKIKGTIGLRQGDIVSKRVYEAMTGADGKLDPVTGAEEMASLNITWDDIDIHVGDQSSLYDTSAKYYGQGNVYGGGYISPESTTGTLGNYTVCRYPAAGSDEAARLAGTYAYEGYNDQWTGLGGNATILVWDNPDNADLTRDVTTLRDHISIGTGKYTKISVKAGDDVVYKFKKVTDPYTRQTRYIKQSTHTVTADELDDFYEFEADGGIYGDGRMVNVEGLRTCDVAYYGYAGSTPQHAKLLNTFQRLDILSLTDCCLNLDGAPDIVTNGHSNPIKYSLTRIGELQMHSSILPDAVLDAGIQDESQLKNIQHNTPRVRNYMGLGYGVLYVGAVQSSVSFNDPYHYPSGGFTASADDNETITYTGTPSYRDFKVKRIHLYYQADDNGDYKIDPVTGKYAKNPDQKTVFDQRNMGTAANMIGINNGYQLHIKGLSSDDQEYYGPALGVFEVKLLSLTLDEGGGYIYALNHHDRAGSKNLYHFLEVPGNFIFPGAHYSSEEPEKANYIFDDCNPMNIGFDGYSSPNEDEEAHFWYVNGSKFYFNVTLSAFTDSNGRTFTLDKENSSLYLYRVEPGAGFAVESINWEDSHNTASDLQDHHSGTSAGKDYRLFLSVGDKSQLPHDFTTNTDDDYVMQVARAGYRDNVTADADITYPTTLTYPSTGGTRDGSVLNDYRSHAEGSPNSPLLGITLHDNVDNASREYYDLHLKEPENVTIGLRATNTEGIDGLTSYYYINLTIHYMLSPIISGNIAIENGALPGEHIFANAFDVDIDKDDNIIIDDYDWWLVPGGVSAYRDDNGKINATDIERDIDAGLIVPVSEEALFSETDHLQLHIPAYRYMDGWGLVYRISVGDSHFYVATSTDEADLNKYPDHPYKPELQVHNYHRMRPICPVENVLEDLKHTSGAWIYIEDQADMDYFFEWLAARQSASARTAESGDVIDPQYGAGITVFLMTDVQMPAGKDYDLRFDGTLHGGGHTIRMGDHKRLVKRAAQVYNTGFIANDTKALIADEGTFTNCFVRYAEQAGSPRYMGGKLWLNDGTLTEATEADFIYGRAAFDLNGFYLAKRAAADATVAASTADDALVSVIEALYADGEYRYATSSADGEDHTALRLYRSTDLTKDDTPNYLSHLDDVRINMLRDDYGTITGFDATRHNDFDPADETRYNETDDRHEPIYYNVDKLGNTVVKTDYLYFGQDIVNAPTPSQLTAGNYATDRVYRASGFYRSKDDHGFHFNRAAHALDPTLTAIDFEGHPNSSSTEVYYKPAADMPDGDITAFDIADGITHNLLVYDTASGLSPLTHYIYSESAAEDDIRAHIIGVADGKPAAELLHLVDLQDFNAPIAFDVTRRAWYERQPEDYNNADGAWEGIALPFTVDRVLAKASGTSVEGDHGWLTHFYGTFEKTDEADSHEYWLRKFIGVTTDGHAGSVGYVASFTRPASADDSVNPEDAKSTFTYSNTFFPDTYGDEYEHTSDAYTAAGIEYRDYRHITAGYPYLIAYPGERFREFDLSGRFYCAHNRYSYDYAVPQTMTYENARGVTVPVSDAALTAFTHGGYSFCGTFMYTSPDGNVYAPADTEFVPESQQILPFRTYLLAPGSDERFTIRQRGVDALDPQDGDDPEDELPSGEDFSITIVDGALIVTASAEMTVDLYNTLGQLCRQLDVKAGRNVYRDLAPAVYVCHGKKFVIQQN